MSIAGNLISNAINFTPQGGLVSVNLSLTENANVLRIRIKDTGTGLSQEQIANILGGKTATTNGTNGEHGYGFGLALVKQLIEGLRGTLDISSNENGAQFEVVLPQPV